MGILLDTSVLREGLSSFLYMFFSGITGKTLTCKTGFRLYGIAYLCTCSATSLSYLLERVLFRESQPTGLMMKACCPDILYVMHGIFLFTWFFRYIQLIFPLTNHSLIFMSFTLPTSTPIQTNASFAVVGYGHT